MSNDLNMTCDDIRRNLKQFLDNLLAEDEYHAFFLHLESCAECKEYVRSIGSLSNQLWRLGDVKVPSDLSSNILFRVSQSKQDAQEKPSVFLKKPVFGAIILIVGLFMFLGGIRFLKPPKPFSEADNRADNAVDDAVIVKEQVIKKQKPVSHDEAEYLFGQLQKMAESLEPVSNIKADKKVPAQEISAEEDLPPSDGPSKSDKAFLPDLRSLHWHIPYSKEAEIKQLLDTIEILDIHLDYEDQDFLVLKTTSEKLKLLSEGIQFTNKLHLNLPKFITEGSFPDREISTSVCFVREGHSASETLHPLSDKKKEILVSLEKETPLNDNALDWHVLLISSQKDGLLDVIRRRGGTIVYRSKDVVIFSIQRSGVVKLAEEIQNMGGIFADFGKTEIDEDLPMRGAVNVLITFSER